jgi:hypothetical protein
MFFIGFNVTGLTLGGESENTKGSDWKVGSFQRKITLTVWTDAVFGGSASVECSYTLLSDFPLD